MKKLVRLLKRRNLTISSCESFTGGKFASLITECPGASAIFKGTIVSYGTDIKTNVVKIDQELINTYGTVSYDCAQAMAENIKDIMNTNIGVSFTGVSGPDPIEGKEVGTVYIGIALDDACYAFLKNYNSNLKRNKIRDLAIKDAEQLLIEIIKDK